MTFAVVLLLSTIKANYVIPAWLLVVLAQQRNAAEWSRTECSLIIHYNTGASFRTCPHTWQTSDRICTSSPYTPYFPQHITADLLFSSIKVHRGPTPALQHLHITIQPQHRYSACLAEGSAVCTTPCDSSCKARP